VVNVGCNHGQEPTLRESHVTSIDKFLGPPNLQVAGQPVVGRSGGGLFSNDGYVIGVCNAADPTDNEGLYAALGSIHAQLDRAKLSGVYQRSTEMLATNNEPRPEASLPSMPAQMPTTRPAAALATDFTRRDRSLPSQVGEFTSLSGNERSMLEAIGNQADSAQVICIVRPQGDAGQSQVVVLDAVSAEFLRQLGLERSLQEGRDSKPASSMPATTTSSGDRSWDTASEFKPVRAAGDPRPQALPAPPPGVGTWQPRWQAPR
jgi:hypothetical protein